MLKITLFTEHLNTLYNNNIPDGRYSDSRRRIVQIEYKCGVVHGIVVYYDVMDYLYVNEYKFGQRHGESYKYKNDKLVELARYKNNLLHGTVEKYDGVHFNHYVYDNNIIHATIIYNRYSILRSVYYGTSCNSFVRLFYDNKEYISFYGSYGERTKINLSIKILIRTIQRRFRKKQYMNIMNVLCGVGLIYDVSGIIMVYL